MVARKAKLLCMLAILLIPSLMPGCSSPWFQSAFGSPGLVISEVCTSNAASLKDEEFGTPDWIELYNQNSAAISLKNYSLSDDIKKPIKFLMPDVSIAPHTYLIVYCSKLTSKTPLQKISAGFKLSSQGCMVILTAAGGDTLSKLQIPALAPDESYARDDKGNYSVTAKPTPNAANILIGVSGAKISEMPATAPVHITEVLVKNGYSITDEDGDRSAWVEIHNSSSAPVSLSVYRLGDNADDPFKWEFPNVTIAPGQYMLVFCSGKDKVTQSGQMHANFKLGSADVQVCLLDMAHMQVQTVTLSNSPKENVSYGEQNGQWLFFGQPTPGAPNTTHGFTSANQATSFNTSGLFISEVSSVQAYGSSDLNWVELYNGTRQTANLSGYSLSDTSEDLKKGVIGNVSVSAGGYTVLYLSKSASQDGVLPIGLNASGQTITLSDPSGAVIDSFQTGVLRPGITSGRNTEDASGTRFFYSRPTKGESNGKSALTGYAAKPVFSEPGGVKTGAVSVSISCDTKSARIRYTVDGSEPTSQSKLYTGPIEISANTPLHAVAECDGLLLSDVETSTYLFTAPHSVPVVCLSMDPDDFYAVYDNIDLYVDIERPGLIEYYENNAIGTTFPAAVRVQGWSSRELLNQKALDLKLDDAFGENEVTYPFFPDCKINTFSSLSLRSAGQDRYLAYVRDVFFNRIATVSGADLDAPATKFVALYINGKYWGLYDLREDISADMLASHYDIDASTINYVRWFSAMHGSLESFNQIDDWACSHDLSNPDSYAQFSQMVDVEAWADYLVFRNYFRDTDLFNQKCWNTADGKIKLRPIYFDSDYALSDTGALSTNLIEPYFEFEGYTTGDGTWINLDVTAALWGSPDFQKLFIERWTTLSAHAFAPDTLVALLDSLQAEMAPEMQRQIDRWGQPESFAFWKDQMDELRSLIKQRPASARQLLVDTFGLTDAEWQVLYQ